MAAWLVSLLLLFTPFVYAQTATSSVQDQIDQTNAQIAELQSEIAQLQSQLNTTTAQKQTLQSAINALNLNIKKLQKSISLTQTQIKQKDSQISSINTTISTTSDAVADMQAGVDESLRELNEYDQESLLAVLLTGASLSDFFNESENIETLRDNLEKNIGQLTVLKTSLQTSKNQVQAARNDLTDLQSNLNQQKQGLSLSLNSQNELLTQTKNKESAYQQQIEQKEEQEKAFEQALQDLQSSLAPVSSKTVPPAKAGTLAWPFSATVMQNCATKAKALGNPDCITQYFGNTDFATQNPQVYNNMGHDGVDIGVPIGTPVEAALGGTVLATGNTDIKAPNGQMCYSFGKWVMLEHPNGLDTLYAHLSDNSVVHKGESVAQGQVIGYSGMTGYATGPHLHFGVYAASGVQIMDLGQWRGSTGTPCTSAGAVLPVAPTNAYLNPLSYLPSE